MNILHLRPNLTRGGAAEYVIRVAEGLAARGHRVTIATGGGEWVDRARPFATVYDDVVMTPRVGARRERPNVPALLAAALRVTQIVRRERVEVINSHHRFAALVGRLAGRLTGVPLVSTMHEIRTDSRRLSQLGLGRAVVTLSEKVRAHVLGSYGVDPARAHVIPMGIALPQPLARERRAALAAELGLRPGAPAVGCVARLVWRKGQIHLIEALPQVLRARPELQLVLVGDGPEREKLAARAHELGVAGSVLFAGARDDAQDLYGLFDFTVLPSLEEEFGIVLIESLALARPVVAAAVGGVPEIIRSGENGVLVPPQDSAALAAGMLRLLGDPGQTAELGAAGRRLVEQRYTLAGMAARTEELYASLARPRGMGAALRSR